MNGRELLSRYIFLVDEKNERNASEKIPQKEGKKTRHVVGPMFQTKCDNEGVICKRFLMANDMIDLNSYMKCSSY